MSIYIQTEISIDGNSCFVEFPKDIKKWVDGIQQYKDNKMVIAIDNLGNGCGTAKMEIKEEFANDTGIVIWINKEIIDNLLDALNIIKIRFDLNHKT